MEEVLIMMNQKIEVNVITIKCDRESRLFSILTNVAECKENQRLWN